MAKVMDNNLKVNKVELQSRMYIHFWPYTLKERYEPLFPHPINRLNSITDILLKNSFGIQDPMKVDMTLKQRNQIKQKHYDKSTRNIWFSTHDFLFSLGIPKIHTKFFYS